jgi:LysM repeat protein
MNKEAPYRDQAERTRKKIMRTKSNNVSPELEEIPPRSKLHRQKRNKNKWKLKYPVIRLLALFFILLPISIFSAYSYLNNDGGGVGNGAVKSGGYEKISIEKDSTNQEKQASLPVSFEEKDMEAEKTAVEPAPLAEDSVPSPADSKNPAVTPKSKVSNKVSPIEPKEAQEIVPNQKHEESNELNQTDEKTVYHTVKEGDNLFRISLTYFNSQHGMDIIRHANNLQGDEVQLGQILKIPLE